MSSLVAKDAPKKTDRQGKGNYEYRGEFPQWLRKGDTT